MKKHYFALLAAVLLSAGAIQAVAADQTELIPQTSAVTPLGTEVEENDLWKRTTTTTDSGVKTEVIESKTSGASRTKTTGNDGHGGTEYFDADGNSTGYIPH